MLEIPAIYSNQEETDTRVVLYLHHAASLGYKNAVVRTPDTDIFVILLYHAHAIKLTVYLDTGSGKQRQLINVTELAESLGEDYCATLLGFYVFTGEDCTSAFKGKGKVGPLKKLEKNPRFHKVFRELGNDWSVSGLMLDQLEQFTCLMYSQSRDSSVDAVRSKMLRKGWMKTEEGILEPLWSYGPVLPTSLVDLLETIDDQGEAEDDCEDDETDSFEFDSDDGDDD